MKKYMLLKFHDFEKNNNHYEEAGSLLTREEVSHEANLIYGEMTALGDPNIRVIAVENHSYGISSEAVEEQLSDLMKDGIYDNVCSGTDMDEESYYSDVDHAFEDVEVKAKLEELVDLINSKADIKYYLFQPWESITYREFKELDA